MEESPLADGFMPPDLSPEVRRFVEIIAAVKALEHSLPLLKEIEEVENRRASTIALVKWADEGPGALHSFLVKELRAYGVRVGQMCQRRKMQLLKEASAEKTASSSPAPASPPLPSPPFPSPPSPFPPSSSGGPSVSEEQKDLLRKKIRASARVRGETLTEKLVERRLV
jgi:hypothetical protein